MARPTLSLIAAAAALFAAASAGAQTLPQVSVTGKAAEAAPGLGGFSDPPARLPMQAISLSAERLADSGIDQLAGLTKLDASVSDSYNAVGYWSQLKVRGFDLDNRFNLRRDGLPINGETSLSLANKAVVEVLKGSSGMQAGTSAPAGLVNLVVKRPLADDATTLMLGAIQGGTVEAGIDHSQRFGMGREFGLRVNLAAARLDPTLRSSKGNSHTAALAADWRVSPDTLVEAEVEFNRQSQPSQDGFSLLGSTLPDARRVDPKLNLNNQPWTQPVVFDNTHASLRVQQKLSGGWSAQAHVGIQRLRTDDRNAFGFGCSAENNYTRYCSDGTFDLYDYRSLNEHRDTTSLDLSASGPVQLAGLRHDLTVGGLTSQFKGRFQRLAYNLTSTPGNIDGSVVVPPAPDLTGENTNRSERSNELYLRDRVALGADTTAWLGLRHTRLHRDSVQTDGSQPVDYSQNLSTPWVALSHAIAADWLAYASWGQGVESEVAPNLPIYVNAGRALPALKSRQTELGLKTGTQRVEGSLTVFDIRRPLWRDTGSCDVKLSCEHRLDGHARHRGIEASVDLKWSGGGLFASAQRLRARREGSAEASLNGLVPPNVPQTTLKAQLRQDLLPGLQALLGLQYEGRRYATPDNGVPVPAWTVADAGLRYTQGVGKQTWIWRAAVDNLANRRAWRESPWQFQHSYLYPLAPRALRASLEVRL
ncbi:TonB-dependent siderophore receptor [Pelomonas aquatica]|jgi:iron complex outermembrane receptor protein|uniref:TonB-dependent siderophore receptor n=1 Tax=Pelomonas aquatica TaxID=431058 RepID=A0A9X4R6H1_9BURK|nr:TonB-dependent siderophore receptor [Pelomonas aquatica]MCY4754596.1 TonB-dependent siderophore receptor [Pelomonas aquatica]MDG0864746.1 TonB-dependent siderophore receptor [Pelomonas aquatica]